MDFFDDPRSLHFDHLREERLVPLGRVAAQVAFANLGPHQFARPGHAKPLDRSFVGLELNFSGWLFSRHDKHSFYTKVRGSRGIRGVFLMILIGYFFLFLLSGARTMSIVRPSMEGACSTRETSASSSAISFRSSMAISG